MVRPEQRSRSPVIVLTVWLPFFSLRPIRVEVYISVPIWISCLPHNTTNSTETRLVSPLLCAVYLEFKMGLAHSKFFVG